MATFPSFYTNGSYESDALLAWHFIFKFHKGKRGESLQKALLTRIAGAHIKDLISRLHILCDDILEAGVALIPVKLFFVFLVTVLPVILLSVLGHFLLLLITITV